MDVQTYIERNRQTANSLFGNQLDGDRNIVGTDLYFDYCWRLRKKEVKQYETILHIR